MIDNPILVKQQSKKKSETKRNIYLLFSILLGLFLIYPDDITWARDRLNYLTYADSSWVIMQSYLNDSILSFLTNEPLFLLINIILSSFLSPENIVKFIIFLSTVIVLYSLGKLTNYNFFVLILFLLLPQIVKNHVIHLRQGLALSIYLLGLVNNQKRYGSILKYLSVFIHSSFIFLILFEFLEKILKKIKFNFTVRILFSAVFLILFIQLIPNLALLFGDRRSLVYDFSIAESASGLGFLMWLVMGTLFILVVKKDYINTIACYGIVFYLLSYFFLDFSARIFENIIPLILVGVLNIQNIYLKFLFILFFIFYGCLTWYSGGGLNFLM
ncbi:EpsG family protein [Aquibacillus salsiterrae]|uniref:EpsG family protein n=1 Tax=Aquibacillus salsiterrae TaxID=2950439 RepID=A0A9X4AEA2_9BACI|nr:EpsG family protein [Aquibacillus salsiterrae]MDC3416602.1 EpsG family protein [Aquibacillus salsiterrae]